MAAGDVLMVLSPLSNEPPVSLNKASLGFRNGHPYLAFDDTTQEWAIFTAYMPTNYSGGDIKVTFVVAMATAVTGTVSFSCGMERLAHADEVSPLDIDADSFGGDNGPVTSVPGTSGYLLFSIITIGFGSASLDGVVANDVVRIRIARVPSVDTATGDAQLYKVIIEEA